MWRLWDWVSPTLQMSQYMVGTAAGVTCQDVAIGANPKIFPPGLEGLNGINKDSGLFGIVWGKE